jgi:hypothetical protein
MKTDGNVDSLVGFVLDKFGIRDEDLLGKGGEGFVYKYGTKALKVYPRLRDVNYLHNVQTFQQELASHNFDFETPYIYEIGEIQGIYYTIERLFHGIPMDARLEHLSTPERQKLYLSYYNAIKQIHAVHYPDKPYGQILPSPESVTADSWQTFLLYILDRQIEKTRDRMSSNVPDFIQKSLKLKEIISFQLHSETKCLVHRDYYLNNVLTNDNLGISAVMDFSIHSAVGDPRMDIASVLMWNEIDPHVKREDYDFLIEHAERDYGSDIQKISDIYLLYSAFYFSDMDDLTFSVKNLNDDRLWERVS